MLNQLTTSFISRLRGQDQAAWFELWETFGPVLRAQLLKWGKGRVGPETVKDLSQETLAALSDCIERYDPKKGAPLQHLAPRRSPSTSWATKWTAETPKNAAATKKLASSTNPG